MGAKTCGGMGVGGPTCMHGRAAVGTGLHAYVQDHVGAGRHTVTAACGTSEAYDDRCSIRSDSSGMQGGRNRQGRRRRSDGG
jgi:hypothetical protein